jgi:peptidoglycan hydrolase-like protein with peptidoglycan-binding domain
MTYSLTWLPQVLEDAGLKVAETPDWRSRGRAEMGQVKGVMCHHTGTARPGNMPTLDVLIRGRPDLRGPLSQLGLGRDGTFYVIAAGRANHAGQGQWEGLNTGNADFIGVEAENSGLPGDEWPPEQLDAYRRGAAAILKHIGANANMCCGHKEYAPGRKDDPDFDMAAFRADVADLLAGKSPPPPIAARDERNRPTLRRTMRSDCVKRLQLFLGVDDDGIFGARTEARLRAWQRANNLVPDGIAGPLTWAAIDRDEEVPLPGTATAPARTVGGHRLGSLSEQYESGGRGPGTVSSGKADPGGVSYGTYQLASAKGVVDAFLAREGAPWHSQFATEHPGTSAFTRIWQEIAAADADAFGDAQHAFVERSHYRPAVDTVRRETGLDLDTRCDAVRDVCWSVAVQHGGAAKILIEAVRAADASAGRGDAGFDRGLIDAIYESRDKYVRNVARGLAADQKKQLIGICENRYPDERSRALKMLEGTV